MITDNDLPPIRELDIGHDIEYIPFSHSAPNVPQSHQLAFDDILEHKVTDTVIMNIESKDIVFSTGFIMCAAVLVFTDNKILFSHIFPFPESYGGTMLDDMESLKIKLKENEMLKNNSKAILVKLTSKYSHTPRERGKEIQQKIDSKHRKELNNIILDLTEKIFEDHPYVNILEVKLPNHKDNYGSASDFMFSVGLGDGYLTVWDENSKKCIVSQRLEDLKNL